MKKNGQKPPGAAPSGRLPAGQSDGAGNTPAATLNEDLAICIAAGCAASAYELAAVRAAGDRDQLPTGLFWYAGGQACDRATALAHSRELARFALSQPSAPGEALYRHAIANIVRRPFRAFCDLPLAERLAFELYMRVLPPLMAEACAEARRAADAAARLVPDRRLPDKGLWKRAAHRTGRSSKRTVLSHPSPAKLEAAE